MHRLLLDLGRFGVEVKVLQFTAMRLLESTHLCRPLCDKIEKAALADNRPRGFKRMC
jgi:hypothetical protein